MTRVIRLEARQKKKHKAQSRINKRPKDKTRKKITQKI